VNFFLFFPPFFKKNWGGEGIVDRGGDGGGGVG
jgi:hypothetical protein